MFHIISHLFHIYFAFISKFKDSTFKFSFFFRISKAIILKFINAKVQISTFQISKTHNKFKISKLNIANVQITRPGFHFGVTKKRKLATN